MSYLPTYFQFSFQLVLSYQLLFKFPATFIHIGVGKVKALKVMQIKVSKLE